jgi:hypothetical protein
MKMLLQTAALAATLAFATVAVAVAENPVVGTWQLNVAKSKFSPGPAPKTDTRTYTESADGITMTWKSTAADGKEISVKSTFKTDGKDYPLTGAPNFDSLTLKQVDSHTVHSIQKKGGKAVGETTRTVSKDGKELTLASKGTGADGVAYNNVMVYDRK